MGGADSGTPSPRGDLSGSGSVRECVEQPEADGSGPGGQAAEQWRRQEAIQPAEVLGHEEKPAGVSPERGARRQCLLGEDPEAATGNLRLGHEQTHARIDKASRPSVVDAQSSGADQRSCEAAGTEGAADAF